MDMGYHGLELMSFFLGKVQQVHSFMDNIVYKYAAEDTAVAILRFDSGAIGIIDSSFSIPYRENFMEIYGTKGTLMAAKTAGPFVDPRLALIDEKGSRKIGVIRKKNQYRAEFEDFADAVINDREPQVNGEAGLENMK